jgi:DNA-binding beta-propeller fold protein YncE
MKSNGPWRIVVLALLGALVAAQSCNRGNEWDDPDGSADADVDADAPDSGSPGCMDADGDGYGTGCDAGPDCDDADPFHHNDCPSCLAGPAEGCLCDATAPIACYEGPAGTIGRGICREGARACIDGVWGACEGQVVPRSGEICNELDDDCDGETDEGVGGECGDCDPSCERSSIGSEGETGWDPREDNSEGVRVDDELGGLVLDSASVNTFLIWVANTAEGSVSKIDVRTYEQLGRYLTGSDPSRTSVNTLGDVYVGNRGGQSLTKVSALGDRCPDTNGDGVITTSSGGDLLPYGQDDCVLWRTELPDCGVIRAVAAQDVFGPDGTMHPYVWVGGWDGCVWKLDGETGEIVINRTPSPVNTYGFALDASGNLWIEHPGGGLGRIDTNRCTDDASCAVDVCGDDGDTCVKQRISQPVSGYGITVDFRQRVWIGSNVARYDPSRPLGERWTTVGVSEFVHGIAADAEGWVWGAGWGSVFRINADNPAEWTAVAGASGYSAKGAAVDAEGKIWMINHSNNNATVIRPGPTLGEATVETGISPVFSTPYTYSDMTGSQLRFATRPRGNYRVTFPGCDDEDTEWGELDYDVFVPERTGVLFRVRTADTVEALAEAEWVVVATVPDDEPPALVGDALDDAGIPHGAWIEVEVQLTSESPDSTVQLTPIVFDLSVTHRCPTIVG